MILTVQQLSQMIVGNPNVKEWHEVILQFLPKNNINTPQRIASFVAQCAHESANFKVLRENLNYRWESLRRVFPKYFPTDELAKQYERQPQKIANRVYANRMGNGPESSGDGWRYCGRGLIQLTGKNNYQSFATHAKMPLDEIPSYLMSYDGAIESACWFWTTNNLNRFADANDIRGQTKVINGGFNGLEDRIKKYESALKILSVK